MKEILKVNNLHVSFVNSKRKTTAVRDLSFSLHEGESLGIVGESGCGKSATAKALLGLFAKSSYPKLEGEALYRDINLLKLSDKELRKIRGKEISMIFQDPMSSLNPMQKIKTQIIEGILKHSPSTTIQNAYEKTLFLLSQVGIQNPELLAESYPHLLSGGMRQRVMIALALSAEPQILLADEPTTALDVTIQAQILRIMKQLQKKMGTSILFISHDLNVIASFCDRILVMYAGKIVENATAENLFANPQHPYTKSLLKALPRIGKETTRFLTPIEGMPPDLSLPIKGCSFCPRCPSAMQICEKKEPPFFHHKKNHCSACWLHDPRNDQIESYAHTSCTN